MKIVFIRQKTKNVQSRRDFVQIVELAKLYNKNLKLAGIEEKDVMVLPVPSDVELLSLDDDLSEISILSEDATEEILSKYLKVVEEMSSK